MSVKSSSFIKINPVQGVFPGRGSSSIIIYTIRKGRPGVYKPALARTRSAQPLSSSSILDFITEIIFL